MTSYKTKFLILGKTLAAALVPSILMTCIRQLAGATFEWESFIQIWLFVITIVILAHFCQPESVERSRIGFHLASIGLAFFIFGITFIYRLTENVLAAWLILTGIYALLLGWVTALEVKVPLWRKLLLEGAFAFTAGAIPSLITQIDTRFSSEEFFVALESVIFIIFWLMLRAMMIFLKHVMPASLKQDPRLQVKRDKLIIILFLCAAIGILFTITAYQRSFFPSEAPSFPGITTQDPFLCGEVPPASDTYLGNNVFEKLLEQVEANPAASTPEFAFLALGTRNPKWAYKFRESILSEAKEERFSDPAGSIKYGQYLASQRAYFYPLVRDTFPELFSSTDQQIITSWFAAINQRTMTVEWVDWMYALAFQYWPQGPYENQENGAGLLSILEYNGLSDPDLSNQNQNYLSENPRGWLNNFRVTDDAASYQPEWMENAWFQSLYTNKLNAINQKLAFEWLKILALPDGSPLRFNHVGALQYANSAFWGANLLNDENLLWLSARALDYLEKNPLPIKGQPGGEKELNLIGNSPTVGSCLLYGNSGLPTQDGPLAPDKVVFRSGWEVDDIYLLLNLRFSGWHRYKATNSLVQIYQNEPLLIENYTGETFDWLPSGRSLFRDKRIPRENLNGLLIGKTGLSAVLYQLTGFEGPWMQDPPFYAKVTRFETNQDLIISSTLIEDWHGWQHMRTIYFYPEGIAAIIDDVNGPKGFPASLVWHFATQYQDPIENRLFLGNSSEKSLSPEVILIPITSEPPKFQSINIDDNQHIIQAKYDAPMNTSFKTATIFLFKDWIGSQAQISDQVLRIYQDGQEITINLSDVSNE
ncbi:MAG: hypothetical protein ACK2U1_09000 [Anaerolineales bacterium]